MKNLRKSIIFWGYIVSFCSSTLSTPFSSLNLCSVNLSSGIPHGIADNFSIHSFALQYKRFLVVGFINGSMKNLSTLCLVVFESAKY